MTALRVPELITGVLEQIAGAFGNIRKEDARYHFIQLLTAMHGVVSLYNNTILDYVHERPEDILEPLLESHLSFFAPTKKSG
jgi:hypothetical protein